MTTALERAKTLLSRGLRPDEAGFVVDTLAGSQAGDLSALPAGSSTDNSLASWSGTTGTVLKSDNVATLTTTTLTLPDAITAVFNGSGTNSTKLGPGSFAPGASSVSIGQQAVASGDDAVNIGHGATSSQPSGAAVLVGALTTLSGSVNGICVGNQSGMDGSGGAIVIGSNNGAGVFPSITSSDSAIVIGASAVVLNSANGVSIGKSSSASGCPDAVTVGPNCVITGTAADCIIVGANSSINTASTCIVVGRSSSSQENGNLIFGHNVNSTQLRAIVHGNNAVINGPDAVILGHGCIANTFCVAIGTAAVNSADSVGIGKNVVMIATNGSVGIGKDIGIIAAGGIGIGTGINIAHNNAICVGNGAISTAVNQFQLGSSGTALSINAYAGLGIWGHAPPSSQPVAIPNAAGGATIDNEARTALNNVLAALRGAGIIAT